MKCIQCSKDIPDDAVFCPACGRKAGSPVKDVAPDPQQKPKKKVFSILEHKALIFFLVLLVIVLLFIFVSSSKKLNPKDFAVEIGKVPAPYERMAALVIYLDKPQSESDLNTVLSLFRELHVPVTLFVTPVSGNVSMDDLFNMPETMEMNLSRINLEGTEIAASSFGAVDIFSLPYAQQELLIKKSKNALRNQGYRVAGFYSPLGAPSFDTLLALENSKFEYAIARTPDNKPMHPDSPLGIKMNVLLLPLAQDADWQKKPGIFVLALSMDALLQNRNGTIQFLQDLRQDSSLLLVNGSEMSRLIREREAISARIVTDVRRFYTQIAFEGLKNNTWLDINGNLDIWSINTSNRSIAYRTNENGFQAFLNETDTNVVIYWKK